jgi:hypothetical protein
VGSRSNMIIEMRGMSSLLVLLLGPAGHGISQDSHYQIPSRILRSPSRLWQSSSKFPSRKPLVMSKISYSTVSTLTRCGRLYPHRPSDVRQVFRTVFRYSLRSDWYSSGRCCLVLPVRELNFHALSTQHCLCPGSVFSMVSATRVIGRRNLERCT